MRRAGETIIQSPHRLPRDQALCFVSPRPALPLAHPLATLGHRCSPVIRHSPASPLPHIFCFPPRGEVTWDCVKTQLSEAALWVWLRLQDITVAFLDWALAMISQQ